MNIGRLQNVRVSEYDMENLTACFDFDGGIPAEIIAAALEDMRKEYGEICAMLKKPTDAQPIPETATAYIGVTLTIDGTANMDLSLDVSADFTNGWNEYIAVREIFTEEEAAALLSIALEVFRGHFAAIFEGLSRSTTRAIRAA